MEENINQSAITSIPLKPLAEVLPPPLLLRPRAPPVHGLRAARLRGHRAEPHVLAEASAGGAAKPGPPGAGIHLGIHGESIGNHSVLWPSLRLVNYCDLSRLKLTLGQNSIWLG